MSSKQQQQQLISGSGSKPGEHPTTTPSEPMACSH
jgi:hypothetical protein